MCNSDRSPDSLRGGIACSKAIGPTLRRFRRVSSPRVPAAAPSPPVRSSTRAPSTPPGVDTPAPPRTSRPRSPRIRRASTPTRADHADPASHGGPPRARMRRTLRMMPRKAPMQWTPPPNMAPPHPRCRPRSPRAADRRRDAPPPLLAWPDARRHHRSRLRPCRDRYPPHARHAAHPARPAQRRRQGRPSPAPPADHRH